jgi:YggT family protein
MFILANLIIALAQVLDYLLTAYMWIVIARAIVSWVNPDPYNPIVRFLYNVTEPVLYRIRRILPVHAGGIDFSPIIVFVAIIFLQRFLVQSLYDLAQSIRYMG